MLDALKRIGEQLQKLYKSSVESPLNWRMVDTVEGVTDKIEEQEESQQEQSQQKSNAKAPKGRSR